MKLGIIGGGRAAWAFGSAWRATGNELSGVATRSPSEISSLLHAPRVDVDTLMRRSEILLVAVSDSALSEVAGNLGSRLAPEMLAFHPSGSESSEVFAPHRGGFSLHPLQSLPAVGGRVDFRSTLFTFEGTESARDIAADFVGKAGGRFVEIQKEQKPLYHAAAVFASNYVAALLEVARDLIRESGVTADVDRELTRLAESAMENWKRGQITGPVARGDSQVIDRHVAALARRGDRAELYRLLASELAKALQAKSF